MRPMTLLQRAGRTFLLLSAGAVLANAKPVSDLESPEKRQAAVQLAQRLTRAPEPAPVPEGLVNPFNPPGFGQGEPDDARAPAASPGKAGLPAPGGGAAPAVSQPAAPQGEREILEVLAAKLPTKGTIILNGEPLLILTGGRVKVGDKFTVAFNGRDYELELVAIARTTFTLRYHGEEIVRSIKNK